MRSVHSSYNALLLYQSILGILYDGKHVKKWSELCVHADSGAVLDEDVACSAVGVTKSKHAFIERTFPGNLM